jgi:sec-independent protein translocase protein TatB
MLSLPHLIVIFVVALVIFGPQKLPELARMLGKATAEFRKMTGDFRYALEEEVRDLDRQARIREVESAAAASSQAQPAQNQPEGAMPRAAPETDVAAPEVVELPSPHAHADPAPAEPEAVITPQEKPPDDNAAV